MDLERDGQGFRAREGHVRLAEDLISADAEGLHPARRGLEPDGPIPEQRLGQLDRFPGLGDAHGLLDGREFLRDLVLDEEGHGVVPAGEREHVLEIERDPVGLVHLGFGQVQGEGLVELIDEPAVGRGDAAVHFEGRIERAVPLAHGQPARLDGVMDEVRARRVFENPEQAGVVDVIGRVFDLDEVLVGQELLGIQGLDASRRGRGDALDEQIGGHRRLPIHRPGFGGHGEREISARFGSISRSFS
ncbi:MAG: hypothetical protein MZV63_58870 [Marinilabiliales bacterium]|nr:hypothetical protein [Marinilabiliales bacterium]